MSAVRAGRRAGFTLIELLAVVMIFGLLAAIALPNLGIRNSRLLDEEARRLAGSLEFARQRAVMTGLPHRVLVDLDRSAYQIESYGPIGVDPEAGEAAATPTGTGGEAAHVDLAAPPAPELGFEPLVGTLGDISELDPAVHFVGVDTPGGTVAAGQVQIVFDRDGTSDPADLVLAIESGRRAILHVLPLADSVRLERVDD